MSSGNWFGRRRSERDFGMRMESKLAYGSSNQTRSKSTVNSGSHSSSSRDRITYLSTCLIGNPVEVQLKNGSVYYGTFYTANAEKDFAIVLKMARMVKDTSLRGQKSEFISKASSKTLIIPGKEVVQVIAKDVNITFDDLSTEFHSQKQHDLMIDSFISKSRLIDTERELTPWMPDEDDMLSPDLENIFDNPWNRRWNQFETNEALFGVKSTFDEELYTTKLEKGPWMRDIEKEASRIAREIEGEDTHDLHTAEERGLQLHESFDDEEMRFSSVNRGPVADDSGYDDETMDLRSGETFGPRPTSSTNADPDKRDPTRDVSRSSLDEASCSQLGADPDTSDNDIAVTSLPSVESEFRTSGWIHKEVIENSKEDILSIPKMDPKSENPKDEMHEVAENREPCSVATNHNTISKETEIVVNSSKMVEAAGNSAEGKSVVETQPLRTRIARPSSSASSTSDQEFKLNPNAKSFTPLRNVSRPFPPPLPDSSFYYSPMPFTIGMQPVIYNNAGPPIQTTPPYFHPGGPPMLVGPRQMVYMPPSFQPDMHYKGREF